jgi:fumarylacetoacetase
MHLPITIPDYVDFYSSQVHAENVGKIFRPGLPPLPAAWRQMPLGYHGRTGTIVVSGTRIPRPKGLHARGDTLDYGPSARLDIEAEVGFIVGTPSELGQPVPIADFSQHVFGLIVVNDWSARDIQAAEYVPLGPFLGKSFATSISPWVVPLAAVEHARIAPPPQQPEPAAYLRDAQPWGLDIALEIEWNGTIVSQPMFAEMYWTPAQQLAHLTANGARVRSGDLYASGTVSSTGTGQVGSFLELTWNGTQPVKLADGSKRGFLEDGDVVTIRASAPGPDHTTITLGEVTGQIIPSR